MKTDDQVAAELRQLLQNAGTDLTVTYIVKRLRDISIGQVKRVARSLPTEFGSYNQQGKQYVKYYTPGEVC